MVFSRDGVSEAVGVTIHEELRVCQDWFFVCSSAAVNECLNGEGAKRLQFMHVTGSDALVVAAMRTVSGHVVDSSVEINH